MYCRVRYHCVSPGAIARSCSSLALGSEVLCGGIASAYKSVRQLQTAFDLTLLIAARDRET